jgi:hypothetical protein
MPCKSKKIVYNNALKLLKNHDPSVGNPIKIRVKMSIEKNNFQRSGFGFTKRKYIWTNPKKCNPIL